MNLINSITNLVEKVSGKKAQRILYAVFFVIATLFANIVSSVWVHLDHFFDPGASLHWWNSIGFHPIKGFLFYLISYAFFTVMAWMTWQEVKVSFGSLHEGHEATARYTTLEELFEQYKHVPQKAENDDDTYPGLSGTLVSRYEDDEKDTKVAFIDDGPAHNMILGRSRSGKDQGKVIPDLDLYTRAEEKPHIITASTKYEVLLASKERVVQRGYEFAVMNLIHLEYSFMYNCLDLIKKAYIDGDIDEAIELCKTFSYPLYHNKNAKEPVWEETAMALVNGVILALCYEFIEKSDNVRKTEKYVSMYSVANMLVELGSMDKNGDTQLDKYFSSLPIGNPAKLEYSTVQFADGQMRSSIFATTQAKIRNFTTPKVAKMMSKTTFDFDRFTGVKSKISEISVNDSEDILSEEAREALENLSQLQYGEIKLKRPQSTDKKLVGKGIPNSDYFLEITGVDRRKISTDGNGNLSVDIYPLTAKDTIKLFNDNNVQLLGYVVKREPEMPVNIEVTGDQNTIRGIAEENREIGIQLPNGKVISTTTDMNGRFEVDLGKQITSEDTVHVFATVIRPQCVFMVLPDYIETNYIIASTWIQQMYHVLSSAAGELGDKLKKRIRVQLNEFGNLPAFSNIGSMISVGAGRGILFDFYLQDPSQLDALYEEHLATLIRSQSMNYFFVLSGNPTAREEFSKILGSKEVTTKSRSGGVFSFHKQITETVKARPLMYDYELGRLTAGETIVERSVKNKDLKGNDVRPHPIMNTGKTKFSFQYEYLADQFNTDGDWRDLNLPKVQAIPLDTYSLEFIKRIKNPINQLEVAEMNLEKEREYEELMNEPGAIADEHYKGFETGKVAANLDEVEELKLVSDRQLFEKAFKPDEFYLIYQILIKEYPEEIARIDLFEYVDEYQKFLNEPVHRPAKEKLNHMGFFLEE